MGVASSFEGEFWVRRTVDPQINAFLDAIRTDARDIAVLADWLTDNNDPRAEAVRACSTFRQTTAFFHTLAPQHVAYLRRFNRTKRIKRIPTVAAAMPDPLREAVGLPIGVEAEYFVGGLGVRGELRDGSIFHNARPPSSQPNLWCQWTPGEDAVSIGWDQIPRFHDYLPWLEYLVKHFLTPWGYQLEGEVHWRGAKVSDRGTIRVVEGKVEVIVR